MPNINKCSRLCNFVLILFTTWTLDFLALILFTYCPLKRRFQFLNFLDLRLILRIGNYRIDTFMHKLEHTASYWMLKTMHLKITIWIYPDLYHSSTRLCKRSINARFCPITAKLK